jgi:hypothetical protein
MHCPIQQVPTLLLLPLLPGTYMLEETQRSQFVSLAQCVCLQEILAPSITDAIPKRVTNHYLDASILNNGEQMDGEQGGLIQ